ncbi:unnamed protein product [Caenorhabditis angaria]|uniref:N-acetyltransferase domain-containing protein n=1 Tax=Caenorhabditis angaria TaxID=860376 RepID=A0A9P1J3I2_9PELO|nr:unnamed protein product [Caenorhabditis angaria]
MSLQFDVINDPPADSELWKAWARLVDQEKWTSDDNSVTTLTPGLASTRSVWAVTKEDRSFIGTVVWNEYDNICFLGFFLLAPEYRGKGCGMTIWKAAIDRMPKEFNLGLRGVPAMAEKYQKMSTPIIGTRLDNYECSAEEFQKLIWAKDVQIHPAKLVRDLSSEEWQKLLDYDKRINARDRHEFLELFYKTLDITEGLVLFDDAHNIIAHIGAVPTAAKEDKLLKIAPLYADSDSVAISAIAQFTKILSEKKPDFKILFHILSTEKGDFLAEIFKSFNLESHTSGLTLYSKNIPNFGTESQVYIPHNNSCHYDY